MLYPLIVALVGVLIYNVTVVLYGLFWSPLKSVPGPFLARVTRLWELGQVRRGHFESVNRELHEIYGPTVRLAPNRYSLSDPEATKKIYGHGAKFKKADFYHAFGAPDVRFADTFSERDIEKHGLKRRKIASLYSMTTLNSYEAFVDKCTAELCTHLDRFATGSSLVSIPTWMQFYAFDVIGEITVAQSFGFMSEGRDHNGILKAIDDSMVYGSRVGLIPGLHPILAHVAAIFKLPIPFDKVLAFISSCQTAREKQHGTEAPGNDFLSKLLQLKRDGKIEQLDLVNSIGANIAAGSDTTAVSLSSVIYHVAKRPSVLHRLRDEIKEFSANGQLSNPGTFKETQQMPYLQAVIKEALRIHPATGQPLVRLVPAGGMVLSGHYFPAGTEVGVNPWVTHFDKSIFGEDAEQFRPERWLNQDVDKVRVMEANFLTFGAGARTCLGKNLSLLEMSKLLPQLYRKYDFELEDPLSAWETDNVWFVKPKFRCLVKLL